MAHQLTNTQSTGGEIVVDQAKAKAVVLLSGGLDSATAAAQAIAALRGAKLDVRSLQSYYA